MLPEALSDYSLQDLIPHRPPMLLLDNILCYENNVLWALVSIRDDSLFCGEDGVVASVGLEYLAQATAAIFSLHAISSDNVQKPQSPQPGMLVASRKYHTTTAVFAKGSDLLIRVSLSSNNLNIIDQAMAPLSLVKVIGEIAIFENSQVLKQKTMFSMKTNELKSLWPDSPAVSGDLSIYLKNSAPNNNLGIQV